MPEAGRNVYPCSGQGMHIGFDGSSTYTGASHNRTRATMSLCRLKLLPLLLCLAGCGQTGPLYLPEKAPPPAGSTTPAPDAARPPDRRE